MHLAHLALPALLGSLLAALPALVGYLVQPWSSTYEAKRNEARMGKGRSPQASNAKVTTDAELPLREMLSQVLGELAPKRAVNPDVRRGYEATLANGELERRMALSQIQYKIPPPAEDEVASICYIVSFFIENPPRGFSINTDRNVHAFIEACKSVYPSMDEGVRSRVERIHRSGGLQWHLTDRVKLRPSISHDVCASAQSRKTEEELRRELGSDAERYLELGVQPLLERTVQLSELGEVFAQGGVARVDVSRLLHPWMFNLTLQQLAAMHPEGAATTPVNSGHHYGSMPRCGELMYYFSRAFPRWGPNSKRTEMAIRGIIPWVLEKHCKPFHTLAEVAEWSKTFMREDIPFSYFEEQNVSSEAIQIFRTEKEVHRVLESMEINLRRLPNLAEDIDFAGAVGLGDLVEHTHRFLWLGATKGGFHEDAYDNLLMQLQGRVDVMVWACNCTGMIFPVGSPTGIRQHEFPLSWLRRHAPNGSSQAHFYHLRMGPGQGVAIPGGCLHSVVSRNTARIGLNAFFEPRFGQMRWPWAPMNPYARNQLDVLAVRALWIRSLRALWDQRNISLALHTTRMELI